jgi:hypothetical protein
MLQGCRGISETTAERESVRAWERQRILSLASVTSQILWALRDRGKPHNGHKTSRTIAVIPIRNGNTFRNASIFTCVTWGFRRGCDEVFRLLRYYGAEEFAQKCPPDFKVYAVSPEAFCWFSSDSAMYVTNFICIWYFNIYASSVTYNLRLDDHPFGSWC